MTKPLKRTPVRKSKKSKPPAPPSAELPTAATQRLSSGDPSVSSGTGGRDASGKFTAGNPYRWEPGTSGNPSGTKGPKLSELLQQAMGLPMPADRKQALQDLIESGATIGQIMAWVVSLNAAEGDLESLTVIGDRTEGAPEQTVKFAGISADDMNKAKADMAHWEQSAFPDAAVPSAPPSEEVADVP